jgi:hypothetical protein
MPSQDINGVNASIVNKFYAGACEHMQAADPDTPCLVGPRPYYNLNTFDKSIVISSNKNVIYSFDYFVPAAYIFGQKHSSKVPVYPGQYKCSDLFQNWVNAENCPNGGDSLINFTASWHRQNLDRAHSLQTSLSVPVFVNQWNAVHGITAANGRYRFISDVASILQDLDIGWAWWTWRGSAGGWKNGSSDIASGSAVDQAAIDAFRPYMSGGTP